MKIERIYTLPEVVRVEGEDHTPSLRGLLCQSGVLWTFGDHVLLRSTDGIRWRDAAYNLREEGSFSVCSVTRDLTDWQVFARSRNGLRCYRLNHSGSIWRALFSIPTGAPGVFATWTAQGLVTASKVEVPANIIGWEVDLGAKETWRRSLPGRAAHWQMTREGIGLCTIWGSKWIRGNLETGPSAVFFTMDCGRDWRQVFTVDIALLVGTRISDDSALVGGADGFLAVVTRDGRRDVWLESGGDVVEVDVEGPCQLAVVEPDDETAVDCLLLRRGSEPWTRHETVFEGRVKGVKLLGPAECIVCTDHVIYNCRLD